MGMERKRQTGVVIRLASREGLDVIVRDYREGIRAGVMIRHRTGYKKLEYRLETLVPVELKEEEMRTDKLGKSADDRREEKLKKIRKVGGFPADVKNGAGFQ